MPSRSLKKLKAWDNPDWTREFERLGAVAKLQIRNSLDDLLRRLLVTPDLLKDPVLRPWYPKPYDCRSSEQQAMGQWIYFRLGDDENRARIVVCYAKNTDVLFLAGRTVIHDFKALRRR
jgi:hypothetical protein